MKYIKLTQNKFTLVDDEDFDRLNQFKWYWTGRYVIRNLKLPGNKRTTKSLHREVLNLSKNILLVDHIDRNTLNNQKINLRLVNNLQNNMNRKIQVNNTSGYKGVTFNKKMSKWRGQIYFKNKYIYLGYFHDPKEAAEIYNKTATNLFGQFANLNTI